MSQLKTDSRTARTDSSNVIRRVTFECLPGDRFRLSVHTTTEIETPNGTIDSPWVPHSDTYESWEVAIKATAGTFGISEEMATAQLEGIIGMARGFANVMESRKSEA